MLKGIVFGHFDKLLLTGLIVFFSLLWLHMVHHGADKDSTQAVQTMLAGFAGALTIIVTKDAKASTPDQMTTLRTTQPTELTLDSGSTVKVQSGTKNAK